MTATEQIRGNAYSQAEQSAREKLDNWVETAIKLENKGYTPRQIDRVKKQLELNAKGIFRT